MNKPVEEDGRSSVALLEVPGRMEDAELATPRDEFEALLAWYDPLI